MTNLYLALPEEVAVAGRRRMDAASTQAAARRSRTLRQEGPRGIPLEML